MPYIYQDPNQKEPSFPNTAKSIHSSGKTYEELRQECLRKGILFEDEDFPANDSSLFYTQKPNIPFVWKRPKVRNRSSILRFKIYTTRFPGHGSLPHHGSDKTSTVFSYPCTALLFINTVLGNDHKPLISLFPIRCTAEVLLCSLGAFISVLHSTLYISSRY